MTRWISCRTGAMKSPRRSTESFGVGARNGVANTITVEGGRASGSFLGRRGRRGGRRGRSGTGRGGRTAGRSRRGGRRVGRRGRRILGARPLHRVGEERRKIG